MEGPEIKGGRSRRDLLATAGRFATVTPAVALLLSQSIIPAHAKQHYKGNNGPGNGVDPQPPGNPPVNDGPGTGPGNPGNRGNQAKVAGLGPATARAHYPQWLGQPTAGGSPARRPGPDPKLVRLLATRNEPRARRCSA